MASIWDKIDTGLATIYLNFLRVRDEGAASVPHIEPAVAEGNKLHVSLHFTGDIAIVENAGFETTWTNGEGWATGSLRLEDLQNIAGCDEVIVIGWGRKPKPNLKVSVPQIKADKVWTLNRASGTFTGPTGAGVLVGVIDTGVDIYHQFLWKQTTPKKETRIRRIWDMGLRPQGAEKTPDRKFLHPGTPGITGDPITSYGVEYKEKLINDVLQDPKRRKEIRHQDCHGHGTFVASIAAGDGRPKFEFVGVAPRAELIVVKMLYLENEPMVGAISVCEDQRFFDAVTYIRKVADDLGMPVAINFSLGDDLGPHDGFRQTDVWLANEFRDTASPGKIFVAAAGNSTGMRQHAQLEFTSTRLVIEIPFELHDTRVNEKALGYCLYHSSTKALPIEFYYRKGGATVKFEVKPKGETVFTPGPTLGLPNVPPQVVPFSGRKCLLSHATERSVLSNGTIIERNKFTAQFENTKTKWQHLRGKYVFRLTASAPIIVHAWCFVEEWPHQYVEVGPDPLPPGVTQDDEFLISRPGSAGNVITVANYDPKPPLNLATDSSLGPLVDLGAGVVAPKPDIGGPGVNIRAANSSNATVVPGKPVSTALSGTSASAPHVTGTVALMLEKHKPLTPSQALAKLQTHALKTPTPVADELGQGRLDAKKTVDNTP